MIKIHYDYTDGTEVSYMDGLRLQRAGISFTTNCLDFFLPENAVCVVTCGRLCIDMAELLQNTGLYTDKIIRPAHNTHRMLKAGAFKWKTPNGKAVTYGL